MQDEGRGTRTNNIRRRLTVSNVCMQAKPSVGKRKNIAEDSSQFMTADIGSRGVVRVTANCFVGNVPNAFGR